MPPPPRTPDALMPFLPAGRRSPPGRRRLRPLLGGMLLGAAMPALGGADEPAPPPRQRLAIAIEALPRTGMYAPQLTDAPASPASPGEPPSLRPAIPMSPGSGAGQAESPAQPLVVVVKRVLAEPSPERVPGDLPNPFTPTWSGSAILVAANDDATPLATEPAPAPPPTGTSGGTDASVVGDEEFLPADELDVPLPSTPPPQPGAPAATSARRSGARWGIPPIRWGGILSAGLRQRSTDTQGDTRTQLYETRLRASTYLIQPYIALLSGDVALTLLRSDTESSAASSNLSGTSITGNGTLSVFPQSRFPFQATLAVSDSRTDGSLTSQDTRRTRLMLRQDYRPEVGNWRSFGQYDRSVLTGSFGDDTVDRLSAGYSSSAGRHNWNANGSISSNRTDDGSTDDGFALARHTYRHSDALSVDSTATYTRQAFERDNIGTDFTGDTQSMQLFSFASWNPHDSPWRGTGNLRYIQTESTFNESSNEGRNFGGSGSLTYEVNRNLDFFGSLNAASNTNNGEQTLITSQILGANYNSDIRMFGEYAYNWYSSGSFSNSTVSDSDAGSERSANASLGHSLQRNWQPTEFTQLSGDVSQSVSTTRSTGLGSRSSSTLNHSASLTLQATPSEQLSGFLSTSLSDSRVIGDETSSFQLLNVQASGRWRINTLSEMNSNLTWQLSRQENDLTDEFGVSSSSGSQQSSLSGNLGYTHVRAFGVRGMRYTLDFRANTNDVDSRQSGNADADRERVTLDLDQRLQYRIGRLDAELQVRVAEVEGRREGLIFFKVSRAFGAF
jgi:hypothetical protein